ncbi:MAG: UDP-N-acetylglucosamine 2-epimerase (non-hydrolyzing) [Bacteroidota bacterium]
MKIILVVGARPNFVKIAQLIKKLKEDSFFSPVLVHTGQHYDYKMSELFFNELSIPQPDIFLNVGNETPTGQIAKMLVEFEKVCINEKPDCVLVVGDVNSTMACSIIASRHRIKLIHLEAGLRSNDKTMPEETNRLITDQLSDLLLTPSLDGNTNLKREGISESKIHFVGNIMIDTLTNYLPQIKQIKAFEKFDLKEKEYLLLTIHRPSNVDNPETLKELLENITMLSKKIKIVFPVHPRTLNSIRSNNLVQENDNIIFIEPLGYIEFTSLMLYSKLVVTDSGGVQEETTALGIPCITMRENTERPITITEGTNIIIGNNYNELFALTDIALLNNWKKASIPKYWDGKTSERIIDVLKKFYND